GIPSGGANHARRQGGGPAAAGGVSGREPTASGGLPAKRALVVAQPAGRPTFQGARRGSLGRPMSVARPPQPASAVPLGLPRPRTPAVAAVLQTWACLASPDERL